MKKHYYLFVLLAGFSFLCSCQEDPDQDNVAFKAEIVSRPGTPNEAFAVADAIGVFEITAGGTLPASIVERENPNEKYLVADAASGALVAETPNTTLEYPRTGSADFIAYYPYRATPVTDPYSITVRLDGQTALDKQQACDLLYSNNAKGHNKSPNVPVTLQFRHSLAKIQLNIVFGEGLLGLTAGDLTSVKLVNFPDSVTLNLADGSTNPGAVDINVTQFSPLAITPVTGAIATYTAIIAPQETGAPNRKIVFIANGEEYIYPIPNSVPYDPGTLYAYDVTIHKTAVQVEASITPWTVTPGTGTAN